MLVVVTAIYVVLTERILSATRRRTELVLVPSISYNMVAARLVNVGQASALQLRVTVNYIADDARWSQTEQFSTGILDPQQSIASTYPFPQHFEDAYLQTLQGDHGRLDRTEAYFNHVHSIAATVEYREPLKRKRKVELPPITNLRETAAELARVQSSGLSESALASALARLVAKEIGQALTLR